MVITDIASAASNRLSDVIMYVDVWGVLYFSLERNRAFLDVITATTIIFLSKII
jgi:hypothetical protein